MKPPLGATNCMAKEQRGENKDNGHEMKVPGDEC